MPRQTFGEGGAHRWQFGIGLPGAGVRGQFCQQGAQGDGRIAQQRAGGAAEAADLLGVDVEADDRQVVVDTPVALLPVKPRADREHRVGGFP